MKNILFIISNFLFTYTHAGICKPTWCDETDGVTQNDGICSCKISDSSTGWVLCGNGQYGKLCKAYSGDGIQGCLKEPLCTNTNRTQENTNACSCQNGMNNFDLCNSDTGLFCQMSDASSVDNVCFSNIYVPPPTCSDTGGHIKILSPCTCGVPMFAWETAPLCAIDQYCRSSSCDTNPKYCDFNTKLIGEGKCTCPGDGNAKTYCIDGEWCKNKACSTDATAPPNCMSNDPPCTCGSHEYCQIPEGSNICTAGQSCTSDQYCTCS